MRSSVSTNVLYRARGAVRLRYACGTAPQRQACLQELDERLAVHRLAAHMAAIFQHKDKEGE